MASMQTRSGVRGRPPPKRWVFLYSGSSKAMASQSSSGMQKRFGMGWSSMTVLLPGSPAAQTPSAAAHRSYSTLVVCRIGSKLIRESAGVPLNEAHAAVNRLLAGEAVELQVPTQQDAQRLTAEAAA